MSTSGTTQDPCEYTLCRGTIRETMFTWPPLTAAAAAVPYIFNVARVSFMCVTSCVVVYNGVCKRNEAQQVQEEQQYHKLHQKYVCVMVCNGV